MSERLGNHLKEPATSSDVAQILAGSCGLPERSFTEGDDLLHPESVTAHVALRVPMVGSRRCRWRSDRVPSSMQAALDDAHFRAHAGPLFGQGPSNRPFISASCGSFPGSFPTSSKGSSEYKMRPFERRGAHARIRTGDLLLTKEMLCRLSYVGGTSVRFYRLRIAALCAKRTHRGHPIRALCAKRT